MPPSTNYDASGAPREGSATDAGEEPVVVLHAESANEARVVEATLEAEGIDAYVHPPSFVLPQHSNVVDSDNPELDVLVPAEDADRAVEILRAAPLTDEELNAAADQPAPAAGSDGAVV
jgi:hypothetical protein